MGYLKQNASLVARILKIENHHKPSTSCFTTTENCVDILISETENREVNRNQQKSAGGHVKCGAKALVGWGLAAIETFMQKGTLISFRLAGIFYTP